MSSAVLDASALLAMLHGEPGGDQVADALDDGAVISAVNLSETVARLTDTGRSPEDIERLIKDTAVEVIPFDEELAYAAGLLRPSTRHAGLSLGDRACLALAQRLGLPALTADRVWQGLSVGVDIRVIR